MDGIDYSSLLPYMRADLGNCCLRVSLISQDSRVSGKAVCPFSIIDDSDPLSRMIEAEFVTDAGDPLKRVFLLIQKDQYQIKKEELWPLGNCDIDESWREAFSFYSRQGPHSPFITLSGQMDGTRELSRFAPLLFCAHQKLFFHPPCPQCGGGLRLCENDELLASEGLQPYSNSLKRYLFCPICRSSGRAEYYVYEKHYTDAHRVKDRQELIGALGGLSEEAVLKDHFPCMECARRGECYGPEKLALSRVVPFCFYPSYVFVFDAMSINAVDFLSLVSGASFDELEAQIAKEGEMGRLHHFRAIKQDGPLTNPFLFDREERHFLEVLYLKITFLEQVLQTLPSGVDPYEHPDLRPSLDRVWVRMADTNGLLPMFWNFRVAVMDIARPPVEPDGCRTGPRRCDLFMPGLLWFTTLVSNSRQDNRAILRILREATARLVMNDHASDILLEGNMRQILRPENVFWNPDGKKIKEKWYFLWERSVRLGWSLIETRFLHDLEWPKDAFLKQLNGLREEIRAALFEEETSQSPTGISEDDEASDRAALSKDDVTIYGILVNILNGWQARAQTAAQRAEKPEELEKTVVMAPKQREAFISHPSEKPEEFEKTVVTAPKQRKEAFSAPSEAKGTRKEDFLTETVILGPTEMTGQVRLHDPSLSREKNASCVNPPFHKKEGSLHSDDLIAETVVAVPTKTRDKGRRGKHEE